MGNSECKAAFGKLRCGGRGGMLQWMSKNFDGETLTVLMCLG